MKQKNLFKKGTKLTRLHYYGPVETNGVKYDTTGYVITNNVANARLSITKIYPMCDNAIATDQRQEVKKDDLQLK